MTPCDPYAEPARWPTADKRLISYLDFKDPNSKGDLRLHKSVLPTETLELIFSHVPSKAALVRIAMASKRFFAIATPILYHDLHYTITSGVDPVLANMFTIESIGLRFVRDFVLTLGRNAYSSNNKASGFQFVRMFLNQVPANTLHNFRWNSPRPLPAAVLRVRWQRHRGLTNLELFSTHSESASVQAEDVDLAAEIERWTFSSLKTVRIVPDSTDAFFTAGAVLQKGTVTELELDCRRWHGVQPDASVSVTEDSDEDDNEDLEDALTGSLFNHLRRVKPGGSPYHDSFTKLVLMDVDLTECKRTWLTYTGLHHLKELRLEHCSGADIFPLCLSAGAATPRIRCLTLVHSLDTSGDRTIHALQELLSLRTQSLRTLVLSLRNARELPSATCTRTRRKTLDKLLLDVAGTSTTQNNGWDNSAAAKHGLVYDESEFEVVLRSCMQLKELGMAFLEYDLEYANFDNECGKFGQ